MKQVYLEDKSKNNTNENTKNIQRINPKLSKNSTGALPAVFVEKSLFYIRKTLFFELWAVPGPPTKRARITLRIRHLSSPILSSKLDLKTDSNTCQKSNSEFYEFVSVLGCQNGTQKATRTC